MSVFKFALLSLRRDWASGELRLIGFSIILAVACLSAVNFFTDRVKRATEQQAAELLAADLVLISSGPIPTGLMQQAKALNLRLSLNESFRSVVVNNETLELAEIKAVDTQYPIRGQLRVTENLFGKEIIATDVPAPGTVWVESRLLQSLRIKPGDTINLGASRLVVSRILTYEPDRGGDLFNIAPRLLMNRNDLDKTGLILPGSRVQYRLLLGGDEQAIKRFRDAVDNEAGAIRIQGIRDARPEINTALERAEQFLGLAALVSIALAGLAIAMSAQRYAARHYDTCAILRCLGLQQRQITRIYFIQLVLLGLSCGLLGCLIGYGAQEGLTKLMAGLMQNDLPRPSLLPVASGLFAGLLTVLAFALPQLMRLQNVAPLRVLRRDLLPLPLNNYLIFSTAIIALMLLSPWQSGDIKLTLYTLAGLFLTAIALAVSAIVMLGLIKKIQPLLKIQARYGLANVARRPGQSMIQIIGIGIGITIMLLLTLIRTDLLNRWQDRLPEHTPNYFLINIQPEQVDEVRRFLSDSLGKDIQLYPMIRGRLTGINDYPVDPDEYDQPRARRLAAREFNLSYAKTMQRDNTLVSGNWWPAEVKTGNYFSVEEGIAETLGINQGDILTYTIAGREIQGEVINLRRVEWDSFNVNFFVVGNTRALIDYPGTFISSFYLPGPDRSVLNDIIKQYPSITVFDVDAILKQVRTIMEQVVHTVEFVFIFTLLTGIAVLLAALQSTHAERTREAALMSALGANRHQILSGLTAEFLCLGFVTGFLSALAASVIELALAEFVFRIEITLNPYIWVVAPAGCCLIIVITGLLGTRRVLDTAPMTTLRKI